MTGAISAWSRIAMVPRPKWEGTAHISKDLAKGVEFSGCFVGH
jgi:hypothetical protein